jgi:predicted nuclease with TOPRIM domain
MNAYQLITKHDPDNTGEFSNEDYIEMFAHTKAVESENQHLTKQVEEAHNELKQVYGKNDGLERDIVILRGEINKSKFQLQEEKSISLMQSTRIKQLEDALESIIDKIARHEISNVATNCIIDIKFMSEQALESKP